MDDVGEGPSLIERAPGSLAGRDLGGGRISLEALIGWGANGEVYGGVHRVLRRPVAVKVLRSSLARARDHCARFYFEALAVSRLDHRNVARVLDYCQDPDGLRYIVMERINGPSLQTIIEEEGAMPTARVVRLVSQACAGIAHAHDAGIVHRDVKPENILVVQGRDDEGDATEIVKVCDFGVARCEPSPQLLTPDECSSDKFDDHLVTGADAAFVVGTPAYMAPEQIRNDPVDARADVYALGVVLYELVTGRVPFDGATPMDVLMRHLKEDPVPPSRFSSSVSSALEEIILRALEKDPDKRQRDARALRAELRSLDDSVRFSRKQRRR